MMGVMTFDMLAINCFLFGFGRHFSVAMVVVV